MPGQPKWRKFLEKMEQIGGEQLVLDAVVEGKTIRDIAKDLGTSRTTLYRYIDEGGDARRAKFQAARRQSAHAMVDDAMEILDEVAENREATSAAVSAASNRANFRRWLAGAVNREEYGEQRKADIEISIGSLHLDALRQHGAAPVLGHAEPLALPEPKGDEDDVGENTEG